MDTRRELWILAGTMARNPIVWQPDATRAQRTAMHEFMRQVGCDDYDALYDWSVTAPAAFWERLVDYCDIRFERPADKTLANPDNIMAAGWFHGAKLNYAAHLLRYHGEQAALVFYGENGARREISRDQLRREVAAVAAGLRSAGVVPGDRVGAYLPNCPEAVIAMLATTSIGAIWSSCSPDFGVNGVVDRFGQIEPKVLFATNGYYYNGKTCDTRETIEGVAGAVASIERTVIVPFAGDVSTDTAIEGALTWDAFAVANSELEFEPALRERVGLLKGCIRRARPASRNALFTGTAVRWCSISRNTSCTRISMPAIGCSISQPAAG